MNLLTKLKIKTENIIDIILGFSSINVREKINIVCLEDYPNEIRNEIRERINKNSVVRFEVEDRVEYILADIDKTQHRP